MTDEAIQASARVLRLNKFDNVGIACTDIRAGSATSMPGIDVRDDIPSGHKVALEPVAEGGAVRRYGQVIGVATCDIEPGQHVHSHNLAMADFERDYAFGADRRNVEPPDVQRSFKGIRRADGRVATRNYIAVISTVNCSATVVKKVARHFDDPAVMADYPMVDGVVPLTHSFGCCIDHHGEGLEQLRRTLAGFAGHANFAGVVLIGLGCEANQLKPLFEEAGLDDGLMVTRLVMQELGGTQAAIDTAIEAVTRMLPVANEVRREDLPLSHLKVALQCGGSDGYSGITANPALGVAVDMLVAQGGTAILSETPEIYGAEHLLTRRAASSEIGLKLVETVRWWEDYAVREKGSIDNNPTPGNKAGGLTTILEKSLGAVAKSGRTPLQGVFRYGERVDAAGLVFMDAPGYDPMGTTGQMAGGANLIAFTTGRGSCFGGRRRRRSRSQRTRQCTNACNPTWISTAARLWRAMPRSTRRAGRYSKRSCAWRPANPARARHWAWATRSSCLG